LSGALPDASANPYLATRRLIAAGLDGIERGLDPGPGCDEDLFALTLGQVRERGIALLPQSCPKRWTRWRPTPWWPARWGPTLMARVLRPQARRGPGLCAARQRLGTRPLRDRVLTLPRAPRTALAAYVSLAASMALVGSYVGLSKLLVAVLPVFLLAWLRFGIAAVAMLHWVRARRATPLSRHDRWLLFWESFLGNFLFSICMLYGVALTSALAAGVAMAAIPARWRCCRASSWRAHGAGRGGLAIACAASGIACWRWRGRAAARRPRRRWAMRC
jgi:hypothetical protein